MKMRGFKYIVCLCLSLFLFHSCSEEQDFSQIDDLQILPTVETSIFYIKTQESLINRVSGISFFTQDFNFDAFEEPFFANRVIEGVITYELENTTSKPIEITLDFLDENENIIYTEFFQMEPAPTATLERDVAYGNTGENLDIIRNTTKIRLSARNLGDNSTESNLPDPAVTLRSSAQFTLEIN